MTGWGRGHTAAIEEAIRLTGLRDTRGGITHLDLCIYYTSYLYQRRAKITVVVTVLIFV